MLPSCACGSANLQEGTPSPKSKINMMTDNHAVVLFLQYDTTATIAGRSHTIAQQHTLPKNSQHEVPTIQSVESSKLLD